MPKFTCIYEHGVGFEKTIEAAGLQQAYDLYLKQVEFYNCRVYVKEKRFFCHGQFFDDHLKSEAERVEEEELKRKKIAEDEKSERKNYAKGGYEFLDIKKEDGFFLLDTDDKVNAQLLFEEIISNSEKGPLFPEEVQYIEKWLSFKHRELGQSLLAQAEAQKPKDQQGKSPLGNMLMAGMAMSTMRLSQDIGEVSDQVENISEGFGFEE